MLYPSIDKLIEKAGSKYSVVVMASKRGRKLLDRENNRDSSVYPRKFIGVALTEIVNDELIIKK